MATLLAKDIMNPEILAVPSDWTVAELASFFAEKAITGAPVVDEDGNLIGVVSTTDIFRQTFQSDKPIRANEPHDYYLHGWEDKLSPEDLSSFHVEEPPDITVREIMTPMIFKIDAKTPISNVAQTMLRGRIHRLLVVDGEQIVGIITTLDMLKLIRDM
jgi:predicted transcriptional regulator